MEDINIIMELIGILQYPLAFGRTIIEIFIIFLAFWMLIIFAGRIRGKK